MRTEAEKNHQYLTLRLGLVAVLASLLVFGGVALVSQPAPSFGTTQLEHSGVVAMSAADSTKHINGEGTVVYWLGPISGYKYTHIDNALPVITMTYWPEGSDITIANQSTLTIATYDNLKVYAANLHPLEDPNTAKIVTARGTTVKFSEASMDYEIVTFKDAPEIIVINYPTSQLATTLMKNAEALKLVP